MIEQARADWWMPRAPPEIHARIERIARERGLVVRRTQLEPAFQALSPEAQASILPAIERLDAVFEKRALRIAVQIGLATDPVIRDCFARALLRAIRADRQRRRRPLLAPPPRPTEEDVIYLR